MSKFTPGPWRAEGSSVSAHHAANDSRLEYWICEKVNGDRRTEATTGRPIDNASLIAAAPELLEALARLLNAASLSAAMRVPFDLDVPVIVAARAAIAKATGESQ